MSLITIVSSDRKSGILKLTKLFLIWFEECGIYLHNEFNLERGYDS